MSLRNMRENLLNRRTSNWPKLLCVLLLVLFVRLTWTPNSEPDLAGYIIYYAKPDEPWLKGHSITVKKDQMKTLVPGTIYYDVQREQVVNLVPGEYCFVVTAFDTEGIESEYSNEACSVPKKPRGMRVE